MVRAASTAPPRLVIHRCRFTIPSAFQVSFLFFSWAILRARRYNVRNKTKSELGVDAIWRYSHEGVVRTIYLSLFPCYKQGNAGQAEDEKGTGKRKRKKIKNKKRISLAKSPLAPRLYCLLIRIPTALGGIRGFKGHSITLFSLFTDLVGPYLTTKQRSLASEPLFRRRRKKSLIL